MTVEGFFNPSHVIRTFLAKEYGFSILYPKHEVRIGHHKGSWTLAKIRDQKIVDFVQIEDYGIGISSENEMTKALFEKFQKDTWEKIKHRYEPDQFTSRDDDAFFIENALTIWGGKTDSIIKIIVVQPGRNSFVDEESGDFKFSPRPEEFKS